MASDLSSGCTEVIEILDEKEEGEISLEDVSSSEEGQLNEGCNSRRRAAGQCPSCLSTKHCASWCPIPTRRSHSKNTTKKDAVQEKENCHHTKDSGYSGSKHPASKLQENNNDLIPISSDSDMEIVGLADNVKPPITLPAKTAKVRKRRRKKRPQNSSAIVENVPVFTTNNPTTPESSLGPKRDSQILKDNHLPRIHRRESNSPHKITSSTFTRSRVTKSPLRRHRSPFGRARSPVPRKSPIRRPRSPIRRSPLLSPTRSPPRRQLGTSLSPSIPSIEMYGDVSKLLKKVRHLKSVGTHSANKNSGKRKGRGPSLKDKLNNMMKTSDVSDNLETEVTGIPNSRKKSTDNHDDEEDLAFLRKMALETKPKKNETTNKDMNVVKEEIAVADDDVEDLELRMIALKSAMLKKHEDRMQRGVVPGKTKKPTPSARTGTESPFSQSFLDSIPIPDEYNEEDFKTPPLTLIQVPNENTNPEDMELDSEVELDKETGAEPYSPTDDISRQITIDSELLGIQPSDVSFITPTSQATVVSDGLSFQTPPDSEKIEILQTGASYLPGNETTENIDLILSSQSTYYSNANIFPSSQSPSGSLYSPSDATEPLGNNFSSQPDDNLPATPYSPSQPIDTPEIYLSPQSDPFFNSDPNQIPDTPYSPTDTPIYDAELNNPPLVFNAQPFIESDMTSRAVDKPPREKRRKGKHLSALINIKLVTNLPIDSLPIQKPLDKKIAGTSLLNTESSSSFYPENMAIDKDNQSETSSMKADNGSAFNSSINSPDSTMITVDELPETDLDGSPLVSVSREIQDIEIYVPGNDVTKITQEPLYLQGVPDVTKDANKIPTLVNRSLVPASILKSNKNLQQPLPPKKAETHQEPAFRSAQMLPVQISNETSKTNPLFKPIKLAPVMKKPQLRIITPSAFNCSSNDNSILEEPGASFNVQSALETSKNEAGTLFEDLQNEALSKRWETIDATMSEQEARIVQPTKTPPLSILEQRTNAVQNQTKNNDTFTICNKESAKNLDENSGKETKTRSRRRRSKNTTKTTRVDKSLETKETTATTSKVTTNDQTANTEMSAPHKQSLNSNKTHKNHTSEDFVQKRRSSREKFKKPGPEKSKRDREERRDRRSGHKYDKTSNNYKQTDANKVNDRRASTKKQQKTTEMLEETDSESQNITSSVELGEIDDKITAKQTKAAPSIAENVKRQDASINKSNQSNVIISNVLRPTPTEDFASVPISGTKDAEESTPDNPTCKKVEASKRRRSSLDDDEEALRAILLASLAKRSKPLDAPITKEETTPLANLTLSPGNTSTESVKGLPDTMGTKVSVNSVYSSSCDTTPPSFSQNPLTLSNSSEKNSNTENLPQDKISDTVIAKDIVPNNAKCDQTLPAAAPSRKRSISSTSKAPFKKIVKKGPISASTKVVNNAKKYQNTLTQKKLNLQKVAMITNAQKILSRNNLHSNKVMDGTRPRTMITQPLSDTQRFVINLASDSESENESETLVKNSNEFINNSRSEPKPVLAIPMSEFEKSVDLFLKDVRKKQETAAAVKPASIVTQKPGSPVTSVHRKSPVLSTTPLAVRHLPVSLQEEYRRLKQQILEREKLKLHNRVLVNNTSPLSPSSKSSGTPPGPLSPASPIASPIMSKQNHNIPTSSQSPVAQSSAKESISRSVVIQSNVKTTASSVITKVSPVISRVNAPILPSISNLSIQIPNETTNPNLNFRKSSNSYIPVNTSQTRLVTAVKTTLDTTKTKDSIVSVKDQSSLKNVQIQLQHGKTGRKVSLGETMSLSPKTVVVPRNKEGEVPETVATSPSSESLVTNSNKTSDTVGAEQKSDNSVDSVASTLIISRDERNNENSTLVDSSTSTIIISRNDTTDSARIESVRSENCTVNSQITKPHTTGQRKSKNNTETWEKIRGDVSKELDAISALPSSDQKSYLTTVEQNLVKKRYAILDDLSEISGNLRQLEMEREVQSNMASEVKKLQEQLKLAEERLQTQRSRVNKMVPNITATYEKFNNGRRECVKMTRICLGLGCLVIGANYKIPAAGAQLLNNRLKQVAGCTRQLSNKKTSASGKKDEVPSAKIDLPIETSIIEKSLNNPLSKSTPSRIHEHNDEESTESVTIGSVTVTEDPKNTDTEFAAIVETDKMDIGEQETLQLEKTTVAPSAEMISIDSPKLTSTPNASKESSSVADYKEDSGTSKSDSILDSPGAGFSGKQDPSVYQKILQPYKSVLTHLMVQRTTNPSGILCPYELMGTCRDEECHFSHHSARNGIIPSEVEYAAAESIPLVAAATPRDGKLSS